MGVAATLPELSEWTHSIELNSLGLGDSISASPLQVAIVSIELHSLGLGVSM